MKIFITHNYKFIYGGEFKQWVDLNIIYPLKDKAELVISNDENMTKYELLNNKFDIIINTGYDPTFLTYISNDRHVKFISIIYDINAERMQSVFDDSSQLSTIIANKAKLIFLSSAIITPSDYVKECLDALYMPYHEYIKMNKIYALKYDYSWLYNDDRKYKRLINERYIVIPIMYNSLDSGFLMPEFIKNLDPYYPIKIIMTTYKDVSKSITSEILENNLNDRVKIFTDLTIDEKYSLYKFAEVSFFLSSFNMHLDDIFISMDAKCLTFLDDKNKFYHKVFNDDIGYFEASDNIDIIINDIISISDEDKTDVIDMQTKALDNLINYKNNDAKSIISILNTINE